MKERRRKEGRRERKERKKEDRREVVSKQILNIHKLKVLVGSSSIFLITSLINDLLISAIFINNLTCLCKAKLSLSQGPAINFLTRKKDQSCKM